MRFVAYPCHLLGLRTSAFDRRRRGTCDPLQRTETSHELVSSAWATNKERWFVRSHSIRWTTIGSGGLGFERHSPKLVASLSLANCVSNYTLVLYLVDKTKTRKHKRQSPRNICGRLNWMWSIVSHDESYGDRTRWKKKGKYIKFGPNSAHVHNNKDM